MRNSFYLGIDPGLSGAIGVLNEAGEYVDVIDMPIMASGKRSGTIKNQVNPTYLIDLLSPYRGCIAVLEGVHSMPGQGVASVFSLGDSFGSIRAALAALQISTEIVYPQTWKKHFNLTRDKEVARAKAIQLFPQALLGRKKDADRAEALLMARYKYEKKIS